MPNIFIADDAEPVLCVLRTFFARHSRFNIVGEARNYDEAFRSVASLKPDIVLLDFRMPGKLPGGESIKSIVGACDCPVVLMSFTSDPELAVLASEAGVARLLDKTKLYHDLIPTLDELLSSGVASC